MDMNTRRSALIEVYGFDPSTFFGRLRLAWRRGIETYLSYDPDAEAERFLCKKERDELNRKADLDIERMVAAASTESMIKLRNALRGDASGETLEYVMGYISNTPQHTQYRFVSRMVNANLHLLRARPVQDWVQKNSHLLTNLSTLQPLG